MRSVTKGFSTDYFICYQEKTFLLKTLNQFPRVFQSYSTPNRVTSLKSYFSPLRDNLLLRRD